MQPYFLGAMTLLEYVIGLEGNLDLPLKKEFSIL